MAVQTGPKNPVFLGLWPPSWSSYDICPRKQEIDGAQDLSIECHRIIFFGRSYGLFSHGYYSCRVYDELKKEFEVHLILGSSLLSCQKRTAGGAKTLSY